MKIFFNSWKKLLSGAQLKLEQSSTVIKLCGFRKCKCYLADLGQLLLDMLRFCNTRKRQTKWFKMLFGLLLKDKALKTSLVIFYHLCSDKLD